MIEMVYCGIMIERQRSLLNGRISNPVTKSKNSYTISSPNIFFSQFQHHLILLQKSKKCVKRTFEEQR